MLSNSKPSCDDCGGYIKEDAVCIHNLEWGPKCWYPIGEIPVCDEKEETTCVE